MVYAELCPILQQQLVILFSEKLYARNLHYVHNCRAVHPYKALDGQMSFEILHRLLLDILSLGGDQRHVVATGLDIEQFVRWDQVDARTILYRDAVDAACG